MRVKSAAEELDASVNEFRNELKQQPPGNVELYWHAKRMEAELSLGLKELDEARLAKRKELTAHVSKKLRSWVPTQIVERVVRAEENPGALVLALTDAEARNEVLMAEVMDLESALQKARNTAHAMTIACANAEAGTELSRCEVAALDDLGLGGEQIALPKQSEFGLSYFREVSEQRRNLKNELNHMTSELKKLRGAVTTAVNVVEGATLSQAEAPADLLGECERLAQRYLNRD